MPIHHIQDRFAYEPNSQERVTTAPLERAESKPDSVPDPLVDLSANLWKDMKSAIRAVENLKRETTSGALDRADRLIRSETFAGIIDRIAKSARRSADASATEWTVVLDLTTDFDHNKDGSFNRMKELEQFAEKTKGTSLAVVVQAAYRIPPNPPVPYGVAYKSEYRLERHVVKDGKITPVFTGKSNGYAQDLEDLVGYASKNHRAPKMALIMDTHGLGNEGLTGDTGTITLSEFVKRVQGGLKGSGRDKFDLVDFDACLMAQNGVLEHVGVVTDRVVASAETEPAKGISLIPPLEILMKKPQTDARELGRIIVNEGRIRAAEFEAKGLRAPLPTVASLELKNYAEFRTSLDDFGDKLVAASRNPETKAAIVQIIDNTFRYKGNDSDDVDQADLKDFTQRIVSAVDDGRLPDNDRVLKRSALAVQAKLGELVDAFYGHKEFEHTGGVSVFLPTWYHRDPTYVAETKVMSGRLLHITAASKYSDANKDEKSREAFAKSVDNELVKVLPLFLAGLWPARAGFSVYDELNELSQARKRFSEATDECERRGAFDDLHKAAKNLNSTLLFRDLFNMNFRDATKSIDHSFRNQLVDNGRSGWSRFQNAFRYNESDK